MASKKGAEKIAKDHVVIALRRRGMTHTPGPWRVDCDSGNDGEAEVIVAADRTICWTADTLNDAGDGVVTRQDRANARLIAAAPELLAVVRMAIDYANDTKERFGIDFDGDDAESYDNLIDAADAAIAKAEGRVE